MIVRIEEMAGGSVADSDSLLDLSVLADLEQRIGRARLIAVLQMQVDQSVIMILKLRQLGSPPGREAMFPIVHQMAGASGTLGLKQLSAAALGIETQMRESSFVPVVDCRDRLCELGKKSINALLLQYPELRLRSVV